MYVHLEKALWFGLSTTSLALGHEIFFLMCPLLLLGTVLNNYAIGRNGGQMPVLIAEKDLVRYFAAPSERHCLVTNETRVAFLCDVIKTSRGWVSIGDVLYDTAKFIQWTYLCFLCVLFLWYWFYGTPPSLPLW